MDPYNNQNYPNYQNNPYPNMPQPDFSINYSGGGGGYPNPGGYPQPGGYNPQPGGFPQPGAGGYPQPGAGGYPQPGGYNPQPYPQYPGSSAPGGYPSAGGYNQSAPNYGGYGTGAGYNEFNPVPPAVPGYQPSGGYPGASQPFPGSYNPAPAPAPGGYNPNPQAPTNTTGNLFPNLATGGGFAASNTGAPSAGSYNTYHGTVVPFQPFNPVEDAGKLYKAMKGIGTNEKALIEVICRRTNQQRIQIASAYKTAYGKDLLKDIISETSGDFEDLLRALLTPRVEFEAHELREALCGIGTDEAALVEIICTKSNAEMIELRNTYRRLFNRDMEKEVRGDVSGYFQRILVSLINANRLDTPPDVNKARQLAQELHKAGEKQLGTDEVTFNRIFALESLPQLKLVFEEYQRLTGHDIERAIKSEMSGDVEKAFLAIAKLAKSPPEYFAERLHNSMKGLGTKDRTLIRNVVLRCEVDMVEIKAAFQRKYSKSLESYVKGDLHGDMERAVLTLIGGH